MAKVTIPQKKFYVYIIRDPRPGKRKVPIYVGKGKDRRAYSHQHRGHKHKNGALRRFFKECKKLKLDAPVEIIKYFNNDMDAFIKEIALIAKYGRVDLKTGTLFNQTSGGEGMSGIAVEKAVKRMKEEHANKEQTKRAIAWAKAVANPKFRKEQSRRFSKTMNQLWSDPLYHKRGSVINRERQRRPEVRKARSISALKQWDDPKFARRNRALLRKRNKSRKFRQHVSACKKRYWAEWRKRQVGK